MHKSTEARRIGAAEDPDLVDPKDQKTVSHELVVRPPKDTRRRLRRFVAYPRVDVQRLHESDLIYDVPM